jgi:hypothetical protein
MTVPMRYRALAFRCRYRVLGRAIAVVLVILGLVGVGLHYLGEFFA